VEKRFLKTIVRKYGHETLLLSFLVVGLLSDPLPQRGEWILNFILLLMIGLVGLPHGAVDIFVLFRKSRNVFRFVGFSFLYLFSALAMWCLWYFGPNLFWFVAFSLAIAHFLRVEWLLRGTDIFVPDLAFAAIFLSPLIHSTSFLKIAEVLGARGFADFLLSRSGLIGLVFVALSIWRVVFFQKRVRHLLLVAIWILTMIWLPLWYSFGSFFIFLHSLRHLELSRSRWSELKSIKMQGLLLLASVGCLLPVFFLVDQIDHFLPFAVLGLLCLTLPHWIVEEFWTDRLPRNDS
jgi:Brp/Blh family beta-carotene 15,15'-monooxygenase